MSKKHLTLAERAFLKVCNPMFAHFQGWRQDVINEEFVRTYGIRGFIKFGKTMNETIALLSEKYGEAEAHHLVGFAGMMNGCRWCGVGHNLSANILIFKESGTLFPIDEQEIPKLQEMEDAAIIALFQERLHAPEWAALLALIERMQQLRSDREAGEELGHSDDDVYLGLAVDLWVWTNECTIETGFDVAPGEVPALALLNKDRALYARYRNARSSG